MSNCYVIRDAGETLVLDPGNGDEGLLASLAMDTVTAIVNTHAHIDHCGGNAALMEATGAPLVLHEADLFLLDNLEAQGDMFGVPKITSPAPARFVADGDTITVGSISFDVLHVPGHSPGHIALYGADSVFVGDVVMAGSVGRVDLPGGDMTQLMDSIQTKLLTLPDTVKVYSGHGPPTTIGEERQNNPYLRVS